MLGESSSANIFFLRQLQTKDITRADIVGAVGSLFRSGRIPNFINAYVNIIANPNTNPPPLAVTGVYSQGCVFRQGRPPTCMVRYRLRLCRNRPRSSYNRYPDG